MGQRTEEDSRTTARSARTASTSVAPPDRAPADEGPSSPSSSAGDTSITGFEATLEMPIPFPPPKG